MKKLIFMNLIIGCIFITFLIPIPIFFIFICIPVLYMKSKFCFILKQPPKKETKKKEVKIEDKINEQVRNRIIRREISKIYEEKQKVLVKKKVNY